MKEARSWSKL